VLSSSPLSNVSGRPGREGYGDGPPTTDRLQSRAVLEDPGAAHQCCESEPHVFS
jgi:hypothetical protein